GGGPRAPGGSSYSSPRSPRTPSRSAGSRSPARTPPPSPPSTALPCEPSSVTNSLFDIPTSERDVVRGVAREAVAVERVRVRSDGGRGSRRRGTERARGRDERRGSRSRRGREGRG